MFKRHLGLLLVPITKPQVRVTEPCAANQKKHSSTYLNNNVELQSPQNQPNKNELQRPQCRTAIMCLTTQIAMNHCIFSISAQLSRSVSRNDLANGKETSISCARHQGARTNKLRMEPMKTKTTTARKQKQTQQTQNILAVLKRVGALGVCPLNINRFA